jgi:hypothetical protein
VKTGKGFRKPFEFNMERSPLPPPPQAKTKVKNELITFEEQKREDSY